MYYIVTLYYIDQILSAKYTLGSDAQPTSLDIYMNSRYTYITYRKATCWWNGLRCIKHYLVGMFGYDLVNIVMVLYGRIF